MNDRVRFGAGAAEDSIGWEAGMSKRCYYETLEVERAASDADLKTAFRKLAMKWHPDRNPEDTSCEQRFKEINEAYEVLKDPDKRAAYGRFGHAAFEQGMGGGAHDFETAAIRVKIAVRTDLLELGTQFAAQRIARGHAQLFGNLRAQFTQRADQAAMLFI